MAVAAASLSTVISEMSSGLTFRSCANCSSLALLTSKLLMSTFHVLPLTTIRGLALVSVLMEEEPRRRMVVPAPRLPDTDTMSRPAIRPWRASSIVFMPSPSNSFVEMVWVAYEISRSGMARPPPLSLLFATTVTSFRLVSDFSVMIYSSLSIGSVCALQPT